MESGLKSSDLPETLVKVEIVRHVFVGFRNDEFENRDLTGVTSGGL